MGLGLAAAGCGEPDGPARASFVRDADAICVSALRERRAIAGALRRAAAGAEPGAIFERTALLTRRDAAVSRTALDRLDALETPGASRDAVGRWLAEERRRVALAEDLADAYAERDERRIALLAERVDELAERNGATARGLGLRRCVGPV